ncbi:heavy-metal-associated domain-containing protein [Nonlabens sp.]|uniref:heavy-metal-associated domain-containing protein n=1 Tax=Nonlabens sp. TaxID=1888209 RepID=UPI003F69BCCD
MRTSIIVQNLKCGGCATTITNKLTELKNISEITVDTNSSTVSFIAQDANDALEVKNKLKTLGYPSIEDTNGVLSKAKSFVSCATGKLAN